VTDIPGGDSVAIGRWVLHKEPAEFDFHRIIQTATIVALLYNGPAGDSYRQIFFDGRDLPKEPNPTWKGYSVGHWEKSESGTSEDTLVVETAGFNDRSWLDVAGPPAFRASAKTGTRPTWSGR
jgi:hypothetical protein